MRLLSLPTTAGLAATLALTASLTAATAHADTPAYTVQTLHFKVRIGANSLGDPATCDVVGDLYTPATASPADRVPAILTTNGFGGSKADQAGLGKAFASRGYEVLSYSGLGFGGSGCKITLDDPSTDGVAASQLISYLGGAPGIAYTDAAHTQAAPVLKVVRLDPKDHAGKAVPYDPRVGMIGGSYGGEIQFATASVDPRLDTIVPLITWNDLSYSLGPNNTGQTTGVSTSTPGTTKLVWGLGFSAEGVADGLENIQADPSRIPPCPNFATFVCPALVTAATLGYFQPDAVAALRHASVASYLGKVRIPTLLMQGENDTLFNLNEAVATYRALKAQGTAVKMVWQSWGHSSLAAAPGEIDLNNPDPTTQYETQRVLAWFDHYLKGSSAGTGPEFSYFRPWITYSGIATPAYATSTSYPVGGATRLYLSGTSLSPTAPAAADGTQSIVAGIAGAPTSIDPLDAAGLFFSGANQLPTADLPLTTATWSTAALAAPLNVAGIPTLRLKVAAPAAALTQALGATGDAVIFVKLVDIDASGKASMINGDIAPVRIPDVNLPFTVTLPGLVHQFAAGHRLGLVIAGGSINYRGGLTPTPVSIVSGPSQVLTLPTVR